MDLSVGGGILGACIVWGVALVAFALGYWLGRSGQREVKEISMPAETKKRTRRR